MTFTESVLVMTALAAAGCGVSTEESSTDDAPSADVKDAARGAWLSTLELSVRRRPEPAAAEAPVTHEDQVALAPPLSKNTTSVEAGDGSRYVGGVFSGLMHAGDELLRSHGGDDVFVMHLLADGSVGWAKAIGSKRDDEAPRLTFADGQLNLIGMTNGDVDCGQGPIQRWTSETFFVCTFDAQGNTEHGATFPAKATAAP